MFLSFKVEILLASSHLNILLGRAICADAKRILAYVLPGHSAVLPDVGDACESDAEPICQPERISEGIADCTRVTRMRKRNVGCLAPHAFCAKHELPQCLKLLFTVDTRKKNAMTTEWLWCTKAKGDNFYSRCGKPVSKID